MQQSDIDSRFDYHRPDEVKGATHQRIREAHKRLAETIDSELPEGREKSLAVTKLEEAMFWSNAAVAREAGVADRTH